jgi:hypothetical protein
MPLLRPSANLPHRARKWHHAASKMEKKFNGFKSAASAFNRRNL